VTSPESLIPVALFTSAVPLGGTTTKFGKGTAWPLVYATASSVGSPGTD
jgi:hypothetical protein